MNDLRLRIAESSVLGITMCFDAGGRNRIFVGIGIGIGNTIAYQF